METRPTTNPVAHPWIAQLTPERLAAGLVFVLIWVLAALMKPQSDTWWQLKAGQDFWLEGAVPMVEQYSHTANGLFWMNHEWLTHVLFYSTYYIGGLPLLTAIAATTCTATLAIIWSMMSGPTMFRLALIGLSITTFARSWAPRPYIFSALLLTLCAKLLLTNRARWLPLVFLVWANLHGGFTLGITLVCASVVAALPDGRNAVLRRLGLLVCCLAATLVTPLGIDFYTELPGSLARLRAYEIVEWQRPTLTNPSLVAFWLLVPALLFFTVRRWKDVLANPSDRLLTVAAFVFLPFALNYVRNVGPFLIFGLPALTRLVPLTMREQASEVLGKARVHATILATAAVVGLAVVGSAWLTPWPGLRWDPLPREARAAIDSCEGRLYNSYNDGGYLIWFMPERQVFVDSRQDPYPVDIVMSDINIRKYGDYQDTFAEHDIRCALLRSSASILVDRLATDGWEERYRDVNWVVLEAG